MSETVPLRTVITGLTGFAAAEEEMLLTGAGGRRAEAGNERLWAAERVPRPDLMSPNAISSAL